MNKSHVNQPFGQRGESPATSTFGSSPGSSPVPTFVIDRGPNHPLQSTTNQEPDLRKKGLKPRSEPSQPPIVAFLAGSRATTGTGATAT